MLLSNQNFEFDNTKWSGWRYNGCGSWLLGVTSNKYVTSSRWSSICPLAHAAPSGGCTCNYYECKAGNETCTCICFTFFLPLFFLPSHPPPSQCPAPHRTHTRGRRMISEQPHPPTSGSWSEEHESVLSYPLLTIINLSDESVMSF